MAVLLNSGRALSEAQIAQLPPDSEVGEFSIQFAPVADGGVAESGFDAGMAMSADMAGWLPAPYGPGAAVVLAVLHGRRGNFPAVYLVGGPPAFDIAGAVDLNSLRTAERAERYVETEVETAADSGPVVINFGHPITPSQKEQLGEQLGGEVVVRELSVQYSLDTPDALTAQVRNQVAAAGLTAEQWQEGRYVVGLPGHAGAAMIVLAAIHGRSGGFPRIFRTEGTPAAGFDVTEIVDLQDIRNRAQAAEADRQAAASIIVDREVLQAVYDMAAMHAATTSVLPDGFLEALDAVAAALES